MKKSRILLLLLAICMTLTLFSSCNAKSDNAAGDMMPTVGGEGKPESNGAPGFIDAEKENAPTEPSERKIIKTYSLVAQTKEFDSAIASLEKLVSENDGYIESSALYDKGLENKNAYNRRASYTLRIPAENAEAFVSSTGTLLHVTSNTSKVEDVSETYYSVEAMLEELYAERDSLLNIMESLNTKSDYDFWLTLQQRLSEVKQKIAVYQAQLNSYDSRVMYSTVTLEVHEVLSYSSQAENNSFGSRVKAAFEESWSDFAVGCQDFAVWFIGAIPTLLILGAIGTGIGFFIRHLVKRRRSKKTGMEEGKLPK